MNIGIVCYPTYGGSGVVATELGKHLARRGHMVHFISHDPPFRLDLFQENVFFHEVAVLSYPLFKYPPYFLALANKMVEVARYAGLDLIHVHYAIPHAPCAYLAREVMGGKGPRVITTLHGTDITLVGSDPSFHEVVAFSLNRSDGVTAVSHKLRETTGELFCISREIKTIYNFIDPTEYRRRENPALRARFASPSEKVIIHISNFRPLKRVDNVVRIFHLVRQEIPSVLLMVGDGPEWHHAYRVAHELGVEGKVLFLGQQERVVELLSVSDLMLLPSLQESFGLVALEAMACEVPVIASLTGGLPEVVADGETGYLLPPDRLKEMAEKAVAVLSDPSLYSRLAAAGRQRAVELFHHEKIVPEYEEYYREVLA